MRIEYLRAKNPPQIPREQVGLWKLWNWPHVAYRVDDLKAAVAGVQNYAVGADGPTVTFVGSETNCADGVALRPRVLPERPRQAMSPKHTF